MDLKIGFRKAKVSVKGGVEYVSVDYSAKDSMYITDVISVKNIADCQSVMEKAISAMKSDEKFENGLYVVSATFEGRKVRGFDEWKKKTAQVEI